MSKGLEKALIGRVNELTDQRDKALEEVERLRKELDTSRKANIFLAQKNQELRNRAISLEADSAKLSALECAGVDNWGGYDYAMEMLREGESQ